ncbi:PaaI family thioesterase [Legionella jamestowniensis]|uniref:Aromatic compounds catabolism n=1 Tax=Legionella jamestowniensis TaxID=455 RepID=A0A0W0UJG5_9GAMM|nr:DUF4442 domain-containing protein [Legionella jamestowniensis]KTD08035.1 aromatic compounds catabolism [Legionella jamestowniensis]OCH97320.1 hypothetical protein A8135_03425 [Legionella jamestowniensis]SFM06261.1 protein of unknown function [Legionella jamestowniensis DSM 19215]
MNTFTRFKLFLWTFGRFKVPLIGHLKPKLIQLTDQQIVIKLPLTRRSKNHLHSMYFGALAVGADLAGGMHSFYHADQARLKVSVVFKSFQAQFLRRPETDVYFICSQGDTVKAMIQESQATQQRVNRPIDIQAFINYPDSPEEVANFILELSVKVV